MTMTEAPNAKALSERARKERIRVARARLDAIGDETTRLAVANDAAQREIAGRNAGERAAAVSYLEAALDEHDRAAAAGTARTEIAAANLGDQARELRAAGLTIAEIADRLAAPAATIRVLVESVDVKPAKAERALRKQRGVRGTGEHREELCPSCGEWKPAPVDGQGSYVKAADFRAGRGDCRACYNKRWLEGKQRRAAKAAG